MINHDLIKVLLIDDDEDDFIITRDYLKEAENSRYDIEWISDIEKAKEAILARQHHIFLVDYRLGKHTGLDLLNFAKENRSKVPFIVLTGQGDREIDMLAMKHGADDYLVKGFLDSNLLERAIRYALERNSIKDELIVREAKYRALFQKSIDSIYIIDKNFNFLECNNSLLSLFGYSQEKIKKMNIEDLFAHHNQFEEFQSMLSKKGQVKDFESILKKEDDSKLICSITTTVLFNKDNEIEGYQGLLRDRTAEIRNAQYMMRAEKLGMTGRMARSIAHEVRNPLTNINLSLDQLKHELNPKGDGEVFLEIIERNSERINKLITEMVDSAKPSKLELTETCINTVIEKTIKLSKDRLHLKDMQFTPILEKNLPPIKVDSKKFKTALLNIVINSIEAMEQGKGHLKISTSKVGNDCVIHINDNGSGMDKETQNKLFDPFFTGKSSGMGLGLTSTQNIVHLHNGSIDVESELGTGSTFIIKLPYEKKNA